MTVTSFAQASPLYAVIDLGSNSFHMLITRQLADSVQVVDKVKRKVRLASGLNSENILSDEAIARGIECLSFFAERLQDIPCENIRLVATATLRIATNANVFLQQAEKLLCRKITVLSGEDEAALIYSGVAHTSHSANKRLVFDIGGASTEIIVGEGATALKITSLNIGCVTFKQQFFGDELINEGNFGKAISAAKAQIEPLVASYKMFGWEDVLGGSGTMQALVEMSVFAKQSPSLSLAYLQSIKAQLIHCHHIDNIDLPGLEVERKPVIFSGLAILIALFECFQVKNLQLSNGALREGLLYSMLGVENCSTIRERTINSLMTKFHVDKQHAQSVKKQISHLFNAFELQGLLENDNNYQLLLACADLHEVGLLLAFKDNQQHSRYIIKNTPLPGFSKTDISLMATLVTYYKGYIDAAELAALATISAVQASYLLAIFRIAVIICQRRKDDVLPCYQVSASKNTIALTIPQTWLDQHPLIIDELSQENDYLTQLRLTITISATAETQ